VHGTAGDLAFVLKNMEHLGRTRSNRDGFMLFINDVSMTMAVKGQLKMTGQQ
jgi:hypothetical protein